MPDRLALRLRLLATRLAPITLLGIWLAISSPVFAQDSAPADEPAAAAASPSASPNASATPALASPRATMRTFLEAFDVEKAPAGIHPLDQAASALDLTAVDPSLRQQVGRHLASQLKEVLDKTELIDIDGLDDRGDAAPWQLDVGGGALVVLAPDASGVWRFTAETLDRMPTLLTEVSARGTVEGVVGAGPTTLPQWLRSQMPTSLLGARFLIEDWQWLCLLALIMLGVLADQLITRSAQSTVRRMLARRSEAMPPRELRSAVRPVGLLAAALIWWLGILWLGLPPQILSVLAVAVKFVAVTAFAWSAYRVVDIVTAVLDHRAQRSDNKFDDLLVPLVRKTSKIIIAVVGAVFIADNVGVDITSLLAGLSIGGLALALAAQDAVRNLFGSLLVILDQPFTVGDWVKIGDVEGTVVELGFRSTRIRTFYDSLITLPNANLIDASVDNLGARTYRRWSTTLGLTYDTPAESVEAFCEGVRELIRRHPHTRKDSFHVYLNSFSSASIDVMLYVFFSTPDWAAELQERHRLSLDILRLAQDLGVDFAFPTQTLYLHRPSDSPSLPDPEHYGARVEAVHRDAREQARRLVDGAASSSSPALKTPAGSLDLDQED